MSAVIKGDYRYVLTREWDRNGPTLHIVMLNPSTADAEQDDPTVRACVDLAKHLGYGAIDVRNLFAYRSSTPSDLEQVEDPVGPQNDQYLSAIRHGRVLGAWGNWGGLHGRGVAVRKLLTNKVVLSLTANRQPTHPLFFVRNGAGWPEPRTWQ